LLQVSQAMGLELVTMAHRRFSRLWTRDFTCRSVSLRAFLRILVMPDSPRREGREYDEFLRRKVERARVSMRAGIGIAQEDVEADAAARRAELLFRADEISRRGGYE